MELFLSILVCFLTVYGAFHILYNISLKLSAADRIRLSNCHRTVIVKGEEEDLEAYIRGLEATLTGNEFVILVDCLMSESMTMLLEQFERVFNFVKVMTIDEYTDYIKELAKSEPNT